jgi:hypothetical protein
MQYMINGGRHFFISKTKLVANSGCHIPDMLQRPKSDNFSSHNYVNQRLPRAPLRPTKLFGTLVHHHLSPHNFVDFRPVRNRIHRLPMRFFFGITAVLLVSCRSTYAVSLDASSESAAEIANEKLRIDRSQLQNRLNGGTVSLKGFKNISREGGKGGKNGKSKKCKDPKLEGSGGCEDGKLTRD